MTNRPLIATSRTAPSVDPKRLAKRLFVITLSTAIILMILLWNNKLWAKDTVNINEDPNIQKQAADFIQTLADRALTSLSHKELSIADQEVRFRKILLDGFDVNYIGKISLGRHRSEASPKDLDIYYALFPEYLVKVYTSRLTKLNTREVQIRQVLPNGKKDMYVRTKIIDAEDKSYDVDWRVRPEVTVAETPNTLPHNYKIVDVKIEGISMARTQRDDFTSRIAESGMAGLINFMKNIATGSIILAGDKAKEEAKVK